MWEANAVTEVERGRERETYTHTHIQICMHEFKEGATGFGMTNLKMCDGVLHLLYPFIVCKHQNLNLTHIGKQKEGGGGISGRRR